MNWLIVIVGGILIPAFSFDSIAQGHRAKVLLELGDNNTSYKLNPEVLEEIKKLRAPIQVISAVGKARVGKSTMLNLITHLLDEKDRDLVEETFATGDSVDAVTRDVWVHIIPNPGGDDERGSVLLMDVEGTDLGNDTVTDHFSMFTAMMSSLLNVFARDYLGNDDKNFLHRISRLSELVFQNQKSLQNFPKLHIIVRTDLKPRDENGDYIRKELFQFEEGKIKKYFQQHEIEVSHIKSVPNVNMLRDIRLLSNTSYWKSLNNTLADIFRNSPIKMSLQGNSVNGEALKELAEKLVEQMNKNEWKSFGDVYVSWEKDICRKSYEKFVKSLLKRTSDEIIESMWKAIEKFKKVCALDSEVQAAETVLKEAVKEAKIREEEKARKREEEKARKKFEKEQEERNGWFTYENLKLAGAVVGSSLFTYFLSDEQLKTNVTTIPYSPYKKIGLNGVCWKWNEEAEKKFGLTGEGCGVIAQEVKSLYPWAVVRSKVAEGYLKVGYHILEEMIFDSLAKN